jgi:hypothetical protein
MYVYIYIHLNQDKGVPLTGKIRFSRVKTGASGSKSIPILLSMHVMLGDTRGFQGFQDIKKAVPEANAQPWP